MKLVISDEDKLDSWETLINSIDKSNIPVEFINDINIIFRVPIDGNNEQNVSIRTFREHGWQDPEIETIIQQTLKEYENNIKTIHFYLDVKHVAHFVQQQTNIILKGIQ